MPALVVRGLELLDGGADHFPALGLEQIAQVFDALGLVHRADQGFGRHEIVVELIVEVGAVNLDDEGRVAQLGMPAQDADEEDHGQALAGALRVPYHADAPVAVGLGGFHRLFHSEPHGEVLVVLGAFLGDLLVDHFVDDEVAHVVQQPRLGEEALDKSLHRAGGLGLHRLAIDGFPRREPLEVGAVHALQRGGAVGQDAAGVELEQARDVVQVVLKLVVGAGHVGRFAPRAFQLEDDQRQAVDVDDDVGPAGVCAFDGELVDDQEVVVLGVVPVDEVDVLVAVCAVDLIFQLVATGEGLVEVHVALVQRHTVGVAGGGHDFVQGLGQQMGVAPCQVRPQPAHQHHGFEIAVEGGGRLVVVAQCPQALNGGVFELGFGALVGRRIGCHFAVSLG